MNKLIIFALALVLFNYNISSLPIIKLETKRLILKPVEIKDALGISNIAQDPKVNKLTGIFPQLENINEVENFVSSFLIGDEKSNISPKYPKSWTIIEKKSNTIVGLFVFVGYSVRNKKAEIGYAFNPKFWNQGYATEACNAIIKYSLKNGLVRLYATVDPKNIASERVLQKSNMQLEGLLRSYMLIDEKPVDRKMYAVIASKNETTGDSKAIV